MDEPTVDETTWPTNCSECGTELQHAVIDFDKSNADRPELRPGEMAAIDFCPNPACPLNAEKATDDPPEAT